MARSVQTILNEIIAAKETESGLSGLTSNSKVAIWRLWAYITAVAINLHEQFWDAMKIELEEIAAAAPTGNLKWLQAQVLKFQYSDSTPQVIELDANYAPRYPVENEELRIISRCAVSQDGNRIVTVKVAKSDPPEPLDNDQYDALNAYLNDDQLGIKFAGTQILIRNAEPDRVKITATIYYNGSYSTVIQDNVKDAIREYLKNIPFDGVFRNSTLMLAIKAVQGVEDVELIEVKARPESVAIGSATDVTRYYPSFAGYLIEEDTAGHTFDDTLTFELNV
jgi:hypothetical protein